MQCEGCLRQAQWEATRHSDQAAFQQQLDTDGQQDPYSDNSLYNVSYKTHVICYYTDQVKHVYHRTGSTKGTLLPMNNPHMSILQELCRQTLQEVQDQGWEAMRGTHINQQITHPQVIGGDNPLQATITQNLGRRNHLQLETKMLNLITSSTTQIVNRQGETEVPKNK